jgi:predicted transglutaminase-like cysteine proteinase
MRYVVRIISSIAMIAVGLWISVSQAAFFGFPRVLKSQLAQISFTSPALPPMAHTRFCLQYAADCEAQSVDFRHRNVQLTAERWGELDTINRAVNREIIPQRNLGGVATERWRVSPQTGECHDYAVTKRHELLARGWPARSLLLSEVVVPSGEHHLVLLVRMKDVDLVLDNLSTNIRTVSQTPYQWVRVESPRDPKYWSSVSVERPVRTAIAQ